MRTIPAKKIWEELGTALFEERAGVQLLSGFGDIESEYRAVRSSLGITDLSHWQVYKGLEEEAIFYLDEVLAANIANIRYGRVVHTFLADRDGMVVSDVYVANNEDEILVMCESLAPDHVIDELMLGASNAKAPLDKVTADHALFSIDGVSAWAPARDLFGPDVLGMPYLSVEPQELSETSITLVRSGKTGEFGYLVLCPAEKSGQVLSKLLEAVERHGGRPFGAAAYDLLKLDGRFFNVYKEGAVVRDPLVLGLQWMVDFTKEGFLGSGPLMKRRASGIRKKVIALKCTDRNDSVDVGDHIFLDGNDVGEVVSAGRSYTLDSCLCLCSIDSEVAFSGLDFSCNGKELESISMPPFVPKSLEVKLDEV